ncbi:SAM-dependent RNA methyltransferase [Papiliotrema laurentii]|uniref:SAM-dependent RNA methyltransferase n=1 Tax=Papiliotrema laurentii TaxID=5418 RepID=A0AAD9L8L2_PAPLA|nr:SAM-dependent RNA methyltransferase [Papiliotrema laurentii]
MAKAYKYIIEHMEEDDESTKALPEWVKLEYSHMLTLTAPNSSVHFTSLSSSSIPPLKDHLASHPQSAHAHAHTEPILDFLASSGIPKERVCLLDPRAPKVISPEDSEVFDVFLYGGILGDDPPRDRTGELRKLGFEGRHLGEKQMTTDTAVGVTKIVIEDQVPLDKIPFTDFPTISFGKHESIEMPFRYVTDAKGEPILPPGMKEHLKADLNRTIDDF